MKEKDDLANILRTKIRIFDTLDRQSNVLKILKKLHKMYQEENVSEMVITFMIGKCNEKGNKIEWMLL